MDQKMTSMKNLTVHLGISNDHYSILKTCIHKKLCIIIYT